MTDDTPPRTHTMQSTQLTNIISLIVVGFSLIYAATILAVSSISQNIAVGWAAVFGASLIFSCTTIPMKSPQLELLHIDSMFFALFTGVGIFIVSLPLTFYLLSTNSFNYKPFSILAAIDIFAINFFAIRAVNLLGIATAPGIWGGCGMLTAFLLGSFAFNERIRNPVYAGVAMALMITGVYSLSTSKGKNVEINTTPLSEKEASNGVDTTTLGEIQLRIRDPQEFPNESENQPNSQPHTPIATTGVLCCLLVGLCDGGLMVPFKISECSGVIDNFNYLASFGLSAGVVSPVLYWIYLSITSRPYPTLQHMRHGTVPGLCSGIIWAAANLLSVIGTARLGMSISFPLTQTCCLWAAAWGFGFYSETVSSRGRFGVGLVSIVLGSYFLAASG